MSRKSESNWVRTFEVTNPTRHRKGFTVYKVTSKVFPRTYPDGVTIITVWKRYSDFKKLHKELRTIHQNLHLGGEFPKFPKARAFGIGRFEGSVVEERQKSALNLLEFAAKYSQLFTSTIFVKFFEHGYHMREQKVNGIHSGVANDSSGCLQPERVWESGDAQKDDDGDDDPSVSGTSSQDPSGIPTDSDSMVSSSILSGAEEVPGLMHPSHTVEFGSLTSDPEKSSAGGDYRSELDTRSEFSATSQRHVTNAFASSENRSLVFSEKSDARDSKNRKKFVPSSKSCSSLDISSSASSTTAAVPTSPPPVEAVKERRRNLKPSWSLSIRRRPDGFAGFFDFLPIFPKKAEEKKVSDEKLLADSLNASYICEAAGHFAVGQQQESIGDLESALEAYKEGITILLAGGQSDKDHKRRLIVRSKVEKYLTKAEELYANLSKGKESNKSLFSSKTIQNLLVPPRPSQVVSSSVDTTVIQPSPLEDLKNYRVVGLPSPGALLVVNIGDKGGPKCCVIKVLRKSSDPIFPSKRTVVPTQVPFMVKLIKWFNTETTIILLLQHAGGGKLEDFVSNFQTKPIAVIPHEISSEEDDEDSGSNQRTNVTISDERNLTEQQNAMSVLAAFAEQLGPKKESSHANRGIENSEELCDSYARLFVDSDAEDSPAGQSPAKLSKTEVVGGGHAAKESVVQEDRSHTRPKGVEVSSNGANPSAVDSSSSSGNVSQAFREEDVKGKEASKESPRTKRRNLMSELKAGSSGTSLDASISWNNLEAVDTGDLIESAKVLIQTVSRTLTQCEADACVSPGAVVQPTSPNFPPETAESIATYPATTNSSQVLNTETKLSKGVIVKPLFSSHPADSLSQGKQRAVVEPSKKNNDSASKCSDNGAAQMTCNVEHKKQTSENTTGVDPRESQFINSSLVKRGSKGTLDGSKIENEGRGCYSFKSEPSSTDELLGKEISIALPPDEQMKLCYEGEQEKGTLDDDEEEEEDLQQEDGSITGKQESHYCQEPEAHNGESNERPCATPVPIQRVVPECCIKVWMAEMVLALEKLHVLGLTYGDLGMRNVLLGENGHILLSFTSQWPEVDHIPSSSDWIAPEVRDSFEFFGSREKIHFSADWWSLGAILFYLLTGKTVQSAHPEGLHANTVLKISDKNILGEDISQHAKSLMAELLQINPNLRLGYYGAEEIKSHPFFTGFDWDGALEGVQF